MGTVVETSMVVEYTPSVLFLGHIRFYSVCSCPWILDLCGVNPIKSKRTPSCLINKLAIG